MSPFFIVVAVVVLVVLAAVALAGAARRRDTDAATGVLSREAVKRDRAARRQAAEVVPVGPSGREVERSVALERRAGQVEPVTAAAPPAVFVAPDPETFDVSRRQFLNRGIVALMGLSIAAFGASIIGFLWPSGGGGFGSKLNLGKVTDLTADVQKGKGFLYKPDGRLWVTLYPASALPKAEQVYAPAVLNAMKAGLSVVYQKCPHLGCRVPACLSSQWFECPCHGSQYNQAGEKKGGPAPRGMDRFATEVNGGNLIVNTGAVIQGPPIGTNTTGQEAEGPHCIGAATHH